MYIYICVCVQYLDLQTKHVTHEDKQIIVTHEQHGIMNIHHTYQSICRNAETISQGSCFKTNSLYCTSKFTVPPVILSMNASTVKYRRVSSFSTCTLDVSTQHFQLLLNPAICQPLTAVPSNCSIAPAPLFDDVCAFLPAPWGPNNSASWNDNTCGGSQARTHQK